MIERLEVVTEQAAPGDGGNAWGGHQTRIVRTGEGVFTVYTAAGGSGGRFNRSWRLMRRTEAGWSEVASGPSGREPVNLLAGPDGRLHVVAWPFKAPVLFSSVLEDGRGKYAQGRLKMEDWPVPGDWEASHWPYNAAGIDAEGNLCVVQSTVSFKPGRFNIALLRPPGRDWTFAVVDKPFRYCYTSVFPERRGLRLASSRDVPYTALGWPVPEGSESYPFMFDAIGVWRSPDISTYPIKRTFRMEAPYHPQRSPRADLRVMDAYVDTAGRMHLLYVLRGPSTEHHHQMWHAILDGERVLTDMHRPDMGYYCRILQDASGRFYILDSENGGQIRAGTDEAGTKFTLPVPLDLRGWKIEYSGLAWAAPRCGAPLADFADVVFPSGEGKAWVYFRILLRPAEESTESP